jgi:hypothetical protein
LNRTLWIMSLLGLLAVFQACNDGVKWTDEDRKRYDEQSRALKDRMRKEAEAKEHAEQLNGEKEQKERDDAIAKLTVPERVTAATKAIRSSPVKESLILAHAYLDTLSEKDKARPQVKKALALLAKTEGDLEVASWSRNYKSPEPPKPTATDECSRLAQIYIEKFDECWPGTRPRVVTVTSVCEMMDIDSVRHRAASWGCDQLRARMNE